MENFLQENFLSEKISPQTLPKVLYLDADTVVLGDAVELYDAAVANGELCTAPLRKQKVGGCRARPNLGRHNVTIY